MNLGMGDPFEGSDAVSREDLEASPTKRRSSAECGTTVKFNIFGRTLHHKVSTIHWQVVEPEVPLGTHIFIPKSVDAFIYIGLSGRRKEA